MLLMCINVHYLKVYTATQMPLRRHSQTFVMMPRHQVSRDKTLFCNSSICLVKYTMCVTIVCFNENVNKQLKKKHMLTL